MLSSFPRASHGAIPFRFTLGYPDCVHSLLRTVGGWQACGVVLIGITNDV
jgi:hypothetical protein